MSRRISELRKSKGNKVTWEDMKEFLGEEMGFWKQFPISWEQEKKLRDEFEQSFVRNKVVFAESMYSKSEPMAARAKEVMDQISMEMCIRDSVIPEAANREISATVVLKRLIEGLE